MSWTDERVEKLISMWNDGKSASQIAKDLGGVTRNAVIGKVHRLGLSNRAAPAASASGSAPAGPAAAAPVRDDPPPARETEAPLEQKSMTEAVRPEPARADAVPAKPAPAQMRPKPPAVPGQPLPPQPSQSEISEEALANLVQVEKKARRLTLLQLTERTCKWPIGDPATDDFWFCGHAAAPGKPYCEAHVAVAFQPLSSRRDRRSGSR